MRRILLSVLAVIAITLAAAPSDARAQASDEQAVRDVVKKLFDGMRAADTVMMKSTLAPQVQMFGIGQDGAITVEGAGNWLANIAQIPAGTVVDEVLHDVEVRIDGPLAIVWTYYDLFVGPTFRHCGYDAFTLLKTGGEWKIVAVADTRRREGCRQQRG
ncbi:MAG TPA: nuclear transport factor 2 family protein [Longimicrobiales bacterium]|nr:nuclear transport factor 2 family protein [Longimicrobiales bacterium]